jgi:predicted Zn-dependent protease
MAIYTEEKAKALLTKVLSYSTADGCECNLNGSNAGNIRYARNTVSTAGEVSDVTLAIQSSFGNRTGVTTLNEFSDDALKRAVKRSEELAKIAPENPEHMPNLGPAEYEKVNGWFKSTADMTPAERAEAADASISPSKENNLTASGFLDNSESFNAIMNEKGLFAYYLSTAVNFTATIRTEDGTGSGWVTRDFSDSSKMNTRKASDIAIQKAMGSRDAKEMEPGKYTVIMEPAATVGLLANMAGSMDQRSADEGRSFLSKKPAEGEEAEEGAPTNKLGEKMFDERITIWSDPKDTDCPTAPFAGDGAPVGKTVWVDKGVIKAMPNTRYWAQKTDSKYYPTAYTGGGLFGGNFQMLMAGGDQTVEEMIKDTRRGVLVTRLWYIRQLDPQTLMYTGLTRDGTFYIEDGEIKYPIKNFRFNESPIVMLNNIEALGKPVRIDGSMIPPMKIRDFTFSSLSDAV